MNLFRDVFPAIGFPVQTFTPITEGLTSFFFSNLYFFYCGKRLYQYNEEVYIILAWESYVAQGTHSYSRRLPALRRFYRETNF